MLPLGGPNASVMAVDDVINMRRCLPELFLPYATSRSFDSITTCRNPIIMFLLRRAAQTAVRTNHLRPFSASQSQNDRKVRSVVVS